MVRAMMVELQTFILLYLFSLAGVAIGLRGLFYGQYGYDTNAKTMLTVFSATFNLFDFFQSFQTSSTVVNVIGILILVGVLIMVPIVLTNLIIAQMTNSYQSVKDNSVREWGFSKARLVQQYVRREEKNLLSTVPAPFNILAVFLAMLGYVASMIAIRLCGSFWKKKEEVTPTYDEVEYQDDILHDQGKLAGLFSNRSC
jgi:hypothetical protein